ncbi:cyclodeaminase [Sediminibacillus massiliensis]|uniref:cyclodeaminase n=1 Tax=Sediminibacillus massiliensis TaxID=1926277 RepID=UPI000988857B|nr:cyclodeaminase [Sediminibacillus massiliensis]
MIVFTETEIREYVKQSNRLLSSIEDGFSRLHFNQVTMPPIMRIDFPENHGEIDVKSAYVKGMDKFAVKMSTGFFLNDRLGLPSGNGLMILFSSETGIPQAALLDNGYLTHLRTAAAGAVAAKYLAKNTIKTVGVIGTGSQARYQIESLKLVRSFDRLLVYGRSADKVEQYINEMGELFEGEIVGCDAEEVVRNSDLVITTTPAESPVIQADWLHPGLHITAMGSDAEHKNEVEPAAFPKVDTIVCDSKTQCLRLGELHHARDVIRESEITELGALTSGWEKGRKREEEITICDLTGTGIQDTMVADFAFETLVKRKVGTRFK